MTKKDSSEVSLIDDPFGLKTIEIAESQDLVEELELDRELEIPDDDLQMENLARVVTDLEDSNKTVQIRVDLATQIAQDQSVELEMRREEHLQEELEEAIPQSMDLDELQSCAEAILFMAEKPMPLKRLYGILGPCFDESTFEEAIKGLMKRYRAPHHGIELVEVGGGYQLRTKPARAPLAKKLSRTLTQRLSSGAMETLAIVAYGQPLMKEEVDRIRGVDSSYFIRGLMEKRLIEISGRSELPGRPMLYSTTQEFLEVFGLKNLQSLPPLHELEAMIPASQTINPEEDPRIREMRRLVGEMKADPGSTLQYDPHEDDRILREFKERVSSIPTSTPYIEEQKKQEIASATAEIAVPDSPAP